MRRAAIVAPVRSAVGTYGGSLRPVPAEQLIANVIKALLARSGLDPARLDDVVMAQSYANGEAPCIGRYAVLEADLPIQARRGQFREQRARRLETKAEIRRLPATCASDLLRHGTEDGTLSA